MPRDRRPDAARPEAGSPSPMLRFPELQGQRGLAALLVPVFHVYQSTYYPYRGSHADTVLASLDATVDWFFVLSAFLLTLPYARSVLAGEAVRSSAQFLGRRAVRILPLYIVAVVLVWAARNPSFPGDWRDLLEHLTFTQVFDSKRIFYTIGPAWSLAVEVQFYVLLAAVGALLGYAGLRLRGRGVRLALLVGTATLAVLASAAWVLVLGVALDRPYEQYPLWFSLPARLGVFGAGSLVAVLVAARPMVLTRGAGWALRLLGIAVLVAAVATRSRTGTGEGFFHLACGAGFSALVLAGAVGSPRGLWHTASAAGFLPWVGVVSYSLYLWHEPLLLWLGAHGLVPHQDEGAFLVTLGVLLPASLLVAWGSYWLIEYPATHLAVFLDDIPSRELQRERRVAP